MTFTVNKVFSDGLIGINGGMWHTVKVRKPHDCERCVEDGKRKLASD
jgi:hypothetical protein